MLNQMIERILTRTRLRRGPRDARSIPRRASRATPRQPRAAQARGPAAGLLVQAPRRLQQDRRSRAEVRRRGVIGASAGNHAQGVALAARELRARRAHRHAGTTPAIKVDAVRALGATIVLHGRHVLRRRRGPCAGPRRDARAHDVHPPLRRSDVIAGQGTIAMEILRQHRGPIARDLRVVGGGGLIAGVGAYVQACARRRA
jgi:threonine dehydratase